MNLEQIFPPNLIVDLFQQGAVAVILLVSTPLVVRLFRLFIRQTMGRLDQQISTRIMVIGSWAIYLIMVLLAVSQLRLRLETIYMVVGLTLLALVLASRTLLANVVSRQFLEVQNSLKVGDWIGIEKHSGRVVEIGQLYTTIVTASNARVMIPNEVLLKKIFVNKSPPEGLRISIPFQLSKKRDLEEVARSLLKLDSKIARELVRERNPEIIVKKVDSDKVHLAMSVWILNPSKEEYVASEVRKKIVSIIK